MATGEAVRLYAEKIESKLDEIGKHQTELKQLYNLAKTAGGIDTTALRSVIAEKRRKKPNAELEAKIDEYRKALAEGATVRAAAAKVGIPKTTAHRLAASQEKKNGTVPPVPLKENGTSAPDDDLAQPHFLKG